MQWNRAAGYLFYTILPTAYHCLHFWRVIYNGHLLWPILSVLILSVYVTFASATIDYRVFCVFIKYSSIFTVSVIVAVS